VGQRGLLKGRGRELERRAPGPVMIRDGPAAAVAATRAGDAPVSPAVEVGDTDASLVGLGWSGIAQPATRWITTGTLLGCVFPAPITTCDTGTSWPSRYAVTRIVDPHRAPKSMPSTPP
jgi:hypothetical protein